MAFVDFETNYGTYKTTIFADGWGKIQEKITQGESYEFVVNDKKILEEIQMDGKVIRVNERRKQWKR